MYSLDQLVFILPSRFEHSSRLGQIDRLDTAERFGILCPLTVWAYDIRIAARRQKVSNVSFVAWLIHQLMFFEFPPHDQWKRK